MTMYRHPASDSTDCIRGKTGFTRNVHVWEIGWKKPQRGTHTIVGVATSSAPLHARGYKALVENSSESWGWDVVKNKLYHKSIHTGSYPKINGSPKIFIVPDKFFVILDMDKGTLSFMANGIYFGVAFDGLKGKTLYPIVTMYSVTYVTPLVNLKIS
ncbi:hypothetical protein KUTeg_001196 [Tegillarca granosa]|uniref:B30.2/SPRY domain-containing protein n=1 Tax=Tegillarca granosa TaxID=220873 RepID=A0ABQ9FVM3_TEGGR|nr:hypothetical protein KUTeg_001196 [Tegillarca granosa]